MCAMTSLLTVRVRVALLSLTLLLCAVVGAALLGGCGTISGKPDRVTILLTGDSRGYLEPCGCRRDQAGGLPVRATLVRRLTDRDPVLFDVGNITSGGRTYELMKLSYLLKGMRSLGYDAVNIGTTDAGLDVASLKTEVSEESLPFVSANVFDKRAGTPIAPLSRIVISGGLRIGVTGVVGNADLADASFGPGVDVKPPVEALAPVIADLAGKCDYVVVLCWSNQDTINLIATRYPEINAIFGGDVPQSSDTAQTINRAINFNVVDQGKVIGQVDLQRTSTGYSVTNSAGIKVSTTGIPGSLDMIDLIRHYKDELRDRRYELASAEGMETIQSQTSAADRYVGAQACMSCHEQAYDVCLQSKHMAAFATLISKNSEYDPECLRCHTVGYGLYSGFVDLQTTPQLKNVQCENCHGRGEQHILLMQKSMLAHRTIPATNSSGGLRAVTPASCIKCHDKDNSENFSYATFWPKIRH